jgi:hypothetical protein
MKERRQATIDALADELAPSVPLRRRAGAALLVVAGIVTLAAVEAVEGIRWGVFRGDAAPFFWVTTGLLALLGIAAANAVIDMARPGVGKRHEAPKWTAAMVAVLPGAALLSMVSHGDHMHTLADPYALHCTTAGLAASLITGAALTAWLRRGAPVSIAAAGWYTGVAAGALGTVAYGFSCSIETLAHLGVWHLAPVAIAALVGRLVVPALIRW